MLTQPLDRSYVRVHLPSRLRRVALLLMFVLAGLLVAPTVLAVDRTGFWIASSLALMCGVATLWSG